MKFRKILAGITAAATVVACLSFTSFAETVVSGDYEYYLPDFGKDPSTAPTERTVEIRKYLGDDKNVVIPNTIDGYTVTAISSSAFSGNENIVTVEIPNTVTTIDWFAFEQCTSLTEVVLPDSLTEIGFWTFRRCTSLEKIVIPDSVTEIGDYAFEECSSLTEIVIPGSVTVIGESPFSLCTSLASITVEEDNANYVSVDGVLFDKDMTTLIQYPAGKQSTKYSIPDTVTTIGGCAFEKCNYLTEVVIPDSVTTIEGSAFADCDSIEDVVIPYSVTTIEGSAFEACDAIEEIFIPAGVTKIGLRAFSRCDSLRSIDVDKNNANYASVDDVLFDKNVTELIQCPADKQGTYSIPDTVTTIDIFAFDCCAALTKVVIPDSVTTIGGLAFYYCNSLTEIVIPDSVTTIEYGAFASCYSLAKVVIPDSVTEIDSQAFIYCSNDLTIYGYTGSYAETYAKENGINFIDLNAVPEETTTTTTQPEETTTTTPAASEETEEPTTTTTAADIDEDEPKTTTTTAPTTKPAPVTQLSDKDTGVQLTAAEGVLEEGAELNVVIGNADIDTNAHIYVLDITLVNAQGEKVQPKGNVTVRIPLPEGFVESDTYYVFYQAEDGTLTNMNATFENGYVSFVTDHFSTYILSAENLIDSSEAETTTAAAAATTTTAAPAATTAATTDSGSDTNLPTGVIIAIIPAIAAAAGVIITKKRK